MVLKVHNELCLRRLSDIIELYDYSLIPFGLQDCVSKCAPHQTAEVLIPAPTACISSPPAPVFHHATSERRGNIGETKTRLNLRRANKARDVTGGL